MGFSTAEQPRNWEKGGICVLSSGIKIYPNKLALSIIDSSAGEELQKGESLTISMHNLLSVSVLPLQSNTRAASGAHAGIMTENFEIV